MSRARSKKSKNFSIRLPKQILLPNPRHPGTPGRPNNNNNRTPEQERTSLLQRLTINRTNSGILEARLSSKRAKENPPAKPKTDQDPNKKPTAAEKLKQYKKDIATLRTNVVLGNWEDVKKYLASLSDQDAKTAYNRILQQLGSSTNVSPRAELSFIGAKSHAQEQYIRPDEIIALSDIAKTKPDESTLKNLAALMKKESPLPPAFFATLKKGTRYFGEK